MRRLVDQLPGLVGGRDPRYWYDVQQVDVGTYAIGEPRYWQRNLSYLIIGSRRALLFDTGSGLSDMSAVVQALTDRPVSVLASHLHWDHIGSHRRFAHVMAPALPQLREAAVTGTARPPLRARLAPRPRPFPVAAWLVPGEQIDLGDRQLTLCHAPGHTDDSVALHDPGYGLLFTGDLLYDGPLAFGLLPGSDLGTARRTLERLARDHPARLVLGGHYGPLAGDRLPASAAALAAVQDGGVQRRGRGVRVHQVDGFRIIASSPQVRAP